MEPQLKPIAEQVVVVVGASSGIGRETARRFAERGASVVVSARSVPGLESLVAEITAAGGRAIAQPADVSDFAQVDAVARRAVDELGRIDTWVHAAAVSVVAPFTALEPAELARVVDVNLVGQGYGALAALPHLRARGGALIMISSILAETAFPLQAPYNASKHGLKGLIDTMRLDLAHEQVPVSVTNIMPATVNTPFFDKARSKIGVVPTAPPPVYEASVVADAILRAAETPLGDVVVGGAGKVQTVLSRLAPGVADTMARVVGVAGERTDEPVVGERPGNLFEPVPGLDTVEGHFGATRPTSAWTWIDSHRAPLVATAGRVVRDLASTAGRVLARDGAGRGGHA